MASPKLFEKMNASCGDLPLASGPNVFFAADYEKAVGIKRAQAVVRIRQLISQGKVRRVRARRPGDARALPAYEYLGD